MKYFRLRNWTTFQHYKDRNPPWVKLHTELLDNYEFSRLQDASKLLAYCVILLAARSDNKIPADPEWIAERASLKQEPDLQPLFDVKFIEWIQELPEAEQDDSETLAECEQDASPRALARGEAEERQSRGRVPRGTDPEWWLDFKLAYPPRAGDQGWRRAQKAANARQSEGHTPDEFIAGAKRYAAFVAATGKSGTEYVKQTASFLGPDKPFLEAWQPPPTVNGKPPGRDPYAGAI